MMLNLKNTTWFVSVLKRLAAPLFTSIGICCTRYIPLPCPGGAGVYVRAVSA